MSTTSGAAPSCRVVGGGKVPLLPNHCEARFYKTLPLPGVIILVHGVNSDGEWYESTERGLCEGLNERLARRPEQMAYSGPTSGRLMPAQYTPELTADGYLAPRRSADNFIDAESHYSPVIRFRWGYKASKTELRQFGKNVWLNENDYWGGGPFANGCSTIADLWTEGLNDRLFLWLTAQHLNPVSGRDVYRCPHRAYYVHAALRLARLIKSVRDRQADCPITVMCHSQGNMVGIAAAFLADRLGVQADNYLLCNPPLSLVPDNFMESWSQRGISDSQGGLGRQTFAARVETLKNFFALLRARATSAHADARIDKEMANSAPKAGPAFTAAEDRQRHGLGGATFGRVTLYCNPHDQVVSAATVQGIGWRGMSAQEIEVTNGQGVFVQRVFAHQYLVGQAPGKSYHYWDDRWNKNAGAGKDGFWVPPSPIVTYRFRQGLASSETIIEKILSVVTAPLVDLITFARQPVNADAGKGWSIPIDAPELPHHFLPTAYRYGKLSPQFDEGIDAAGSARDAGKSEVNKTTGDPYDEHATLMSEDGSANDAAQGDQESEARLRYEHRARLRMQARRGERTDAGGNVAGEQPGGLATEEYQAWRTEQIGTFLKEGVDQSATDHSTIVTNSEHARLAAAYDVAVGVCTLSEEEMQELRVEADWRYGGGLKKQHLHRYFAEYFHKSTMQGESLENWLSSEEATRPPGIVDERSWKIAKPEGR
jgi:pimeloyl-ACP methyl ester carboxylesterase